MLAGAGCIPDGVAADVQSMLARQVVERAEALVAELVREYGKPDAIVLKAHDAPALRPGTRWRRHCKRGIKVEVRWAHAALLRRSARMPMRVGQQQQRVGLVIVARLQPAGWLAITSSLLACPLPNRSYWWRWWERIGVALNHQLRDRNEYVSQ